MIFLLLWRFNKSSIFFS